MMPMMGGGGKASKKRPPEPHHHQARQPPTLPAVIVHRMLENHVPSKPTLSRAGSMSGERLSKSKHGKTLSIREYHRDGTRKDETFSVRELYLYVLDASRRINTPASPDVSHPTSLSGLMHQAQHSNGSAISHYVHAQQQLHQSLGSVPEGARSPASVAPAHVMQHVPRYATQTLAGMNLGMKLQSRDIRRLVHSAASEDVVIQVRKNVVLLKLANSFKGILLWDRLIALLPSSDDDDTSTDFEIKIVEREPFIQEFERNLREAEHQNEFILDAEDNDTAGDSPGGGSGIVEYELVLLEAVLTTLVGRLTRCVERFLPQVKTLLHQLDASRTFRIKQQNILRNLCDEHLRYDARCRAILTSLEQLLEEDNDMMLMSLTKLHFDMEFLTHEASALHEQVEVLIESHRLDMRHMMARLDMLKSQLSASEKLASLKLDMATNRLLTAGAIFGAGSMCCAFGGFIVGSFGMNLGNGISSEFNVNDYRVFVVVVVITLIMMLSSTAAIIWYLYRSRTLVV